MVALYQNLVIIPQINHESAIYMHIPVNSPQDPLIVWAKAPVVPGYVPLICYAATMDKVMELGSLAKLGEYLGLVHGNPGPMPEGFPSVETDGLKNPRAIFRGLRRPLHFLHPDADTDVYIYVTCPEWTYSYRRSLRGDAVVAEKKPISSVFTTFVSFHSQHVDEARRRVEKTTQDTTPVGSILFWEWTESAPESSFLPYDAKGRYESRIYRGYDDQPSGIRD